MVHIKPANARKSKPKHTIKRTRFSIQTTVIVFIIALLAIGLAYYTFKDTLLYPLRVQIHRSIPQPKPSPRPIAHGKQAFSASGGYPNGPHFVGGYLDPYDPVDKTKQVVSVQIKSASPVLSFYGIVRSDNKFTTIRFTLTGGTATDGTWEGVWNVDDTYLYNYELNLYASSKDGSNKLEMTLR